MGKYWSHSKESREKISKAASRRYAGRKVLVNCIKCGEEFSTTIARQEDGRGKYCSKKCMYADKKGKRHSPETEFKKGQKPKNYIGNKEVCEQCGVEFESAPSVGAKFCSRECKDNAHREKRGSEAPNWRGGITPENQRIRHSDEYKLWRASVFERDNYTCQDCEKHGCYLEAHHIKSFAEYPELRFDVSNGITYCKKCHANADEIRKRLLGGNYE